MSFVQALGRLLEFGWALDCGLFGVVAPVSSAVVMASEAELFFLWVAMVRIVRYGKALWTVLKEARMVSVESGIEGK